MTTVFDQIINEIGQHNPDQSWSIFTNESLPKIKDKYDLYSTQLRKTIIDLYHDKFNTILMKYFADLKSKVPKGTSEEPANISAQIFKIS